MLWTTLDETQHQRRAHGVCFWDTATHVVAHHVTRILLFLSSQTKLETSTRTHSPFRCSNSCRSLATWEALENLGLWDAISASVEFPMYKRVTWYSSFITIPDLFAGSKSLDPFQRLERSKVEFASMWIDQYKTGGVLDRLPRLVHNDNTTTPTTKRPKEMRAPTNTASVRFMFPKPLKFWRAWSCRCKIQSKSWSLLCSAKRVECERCTKYSPLPDA